MKIGILTYHRAENYGALLQAYALRTYLRQQGHDVSFVDYWPKYHVEHYKVFSFTKFRKLGFMGKIKYFLLFLLWGIPRSVRKKRLEHFMREHLDLNSRIKYQDDNDTTESYDLVVYGSDQIWRRQNINGNKFNLWYFGSSNVMAKRKITYAASMGIIDTNAEENLQIHQWLKNFDAISVREQYLKEYVEKLGFDVQLVSDPVFLLPKESWRKLYRPANKGKYILFYNLLNSSDSVKFANALSRVTGLPIKEINMEFSPKRLVSKRYIACSSLEHFLQLLDGAEYVVSNSFHGVALSLVMEKQFWAVGFGKKAGRVISLLNSAGLSDRYCTDSFSKSMLELPIHYEIKIKDNVQALISQSVLYLNKYLHA